MKSLTISNRIYFKGDKILVILDKRGDFFLVILSLKSLIQ